MDKKCGYVYLVGDWGKEGTYKIGVTRGKIENRIKKLQTGNSGDIYIVDYYRTEYPFFMEKNLHLRFHGSKVRDEWFKLTADDVKRFKEYCIKAEKLIESLKENPFFNKKKKK